MEGGEGRVWVGAEGSPAFAPTPDDRQRFLGLVQQYRDANAVRGGGPRAPQPSGELLELFRSSADLVIMDKEAAGSGGCSSTFHGRLGAGVTISIDAVPAVFKTGLLSQHPICRQLFSTGMGLQGNSHATTTAAATEARRDQAVQEVYERFETACDDLDSGLFDLDLDQHCYCCMQFFDGAIDRKRLYTDGHVWCAACSYKVHSKDGRGGQHPERPNNRCSSGCAGCSPVRR